MGNIVGKNSCNGGIKIETRQPSRIVGYQSSGAKDKNTPPLQYMRWEELTNMGTGRNNQNILYPGK